MDILRRHFVFDGVECASIEGALQSFKFSDPEKQREVCALIGIKAKKAGSQTDWRPAQTLYWNGMEYPRDSAAYQELLDRLYMAVYKQDQWFVSDLYATGKHDLIHTIGNSDPAETVLTEREFCDRLMKLRESINKETLGGGCMAIYDCFTYVEDESSITIRKYTGGGGIVNIPNEINGKPVTDVSYCAFEDCRNIEFLTIPNNVKTMYQAFDNVIGGSFACGIKRIYIGSGCKHLSNLCLVHELQSIEVAPDNQYYSAVNGVLFNKSQTVLERYPPAKADESFTIPDDVARIAGRAFQGCRYLKSVTLGKHIKEIDKYTFFECCALTEIIYTGETKMFPDAYSPKEWSELVLKYRLDGFDGSDLKVYSRNSYSYELIWDDVDINKLAIQKNWFKMILEDKDEFDKLCREYALMFVWYED